MELDVGITLFVVLNDCASCFRLYISGKINQSGLQKLISGNFLMKKAEF